jgi:hypothetical protein
LQLIIVYPDRVMGTGGASHDFGESVVDFEVGPPPVAMKLEWADGVVIERPNGAVAEPVVVIFDLFFAEHHGSVLDSGGSECP